MIAVFRENVVQYYLKKNIVHLNNSSFFFATFHKILTLCIHNLGIGNEAENLTKFQSQISLSHLEGSL